MPPSGYNKELTEKLSGFLFGCLHDLIEENRGVRTPHEAVAREIRHIDADLSEHERPPAVEATLRLTRAFYEKTLGNVPAEESSFDRLSIIGTAAFREVADEIVAIHVTGD